MTFRFAYHNKILAILHCLDANLLEKDLAYFGGGTLIALDFKEYRWSKDADFICPSPSIGYKHLRNIVFDGGHNALFSDLSRIQVGRGTANQYGIRVQVEIEDVPIKIEIIAEGRFELDPPRYPAWSPVACLSLNDCFTSKLLANADRFMDDSIEARDLIDLAVLRLQSPIPQTALEKAESAYEVIPSLERAIQRFQERIDYRDRFFSSLQVEASQIPKIIDGVDLLAEDVGLARTQRTFKEQHDVFAELEDPEHQT
jgi:Nucleotidyl transferase AbiEii toxin, Type IV TA system